MNIRCPHCDFSRNVDPAKVPAGTTRVTCPQCRQVFTFNPATDRAAQTAPPPPSEQTVCPACGLQQPTGDSCEGCGIIYEKWQRRQHELGQNPLSTETASEPTAAELPKAGFWVRVVASVVDSILVTVVQMVLGFILGLTAGLAGGDLSGEGNVMLGLTTGLFGMVLAVAYYVFFTGYCGQTPGKMAVRIKVIRTDGANIGYGSALLRETIGKGISTILFGIGYLMVAFDSQKQGLHDKIASTYVIKL
ncbi:RDD family protein [Desulfuromonas sp. AOP6]|uniref:RDD family protein n=1 Tax=Desulfuromonas sp. AOP6 TaxID=1566351 RepID=UPI00127E0208|nr:RDD family protein [Desulfuromonas sp. AOP6]BCA78782.1 hypothetical protein AOP6_0569 [Desulfuromonas sp. AOP6]